MPPLPRVDLVHPPPYGEVPFKHPGPCATSQQDCVPRGSKPDTTTSPNATTVPALTSTTSWCSDSRFKLET